MVVEPVLCGVMDAVPPRGGGRGQAASVHIRSGGRDRQAECAEATGRRCGGSHAWRPSAQVRSANSAGAPAPPCGPAGTCTTTATAPTPARAGRRTSGSLTETRVRDWQDWPERFDGSADRHMNPNHVIF